MHPAALVGLPWKQRPMAPTIPQCWSEMTNCTPLRPLERTDRRKSRQKTLSSESPTSRPSISRCPLHSLHPALTPFVGTGADHGGGFGLDQLLYIAHGGADKIDTIGRFDCLQQLGPDRLVDGHRGALLGAFGQKHTDNHPGGTTYRWMPRLRSNAHQAGDVLSATLPRVRRHQDRNAAHEPVDPTNPSSGQSWHQHSSIPRTLGPEAGRWTPAMT